jgi:uncharacterized protein with GYD domain
LNRATRREEEAVPTYVALINWTEQGVKNFKDTVDRYESASGEVERLGVSFKEIYWTVGPYDLVSIMEAPDDETAAAGLLAISSQGNIRSTTLRAFSADEMRGVIQKVG